MRTVSSIVRGTGGSLVTRCSWITDERKLNQRATNRARRAFCESKNKKRPCVQGPSVKSLGTRACSRLRVEVARRAPERVMGDVKVGWVDHGLTKATTAVKLVEVSNKSGGLLRPTLSNIALAAATRPHHLLRSAHRAAGFRRRGSRQRAS